MLHYFPDISRGTFVKEEIFGNRCQLVIGARPWLVNGVLRVSFPRTVQIMRARALKALPPKSSLWRIERRQASANSRNIGGGIWFGLEIQGVEID